MIYPNFLYEKKVRKYGYQLIAGIDEVGRGAVAGPVVAGCVVFKPGLKIPSASVRIDDSKKLTARKREVSSKWIKQNCLTWGVGEASAKEIDKLGIVKATNKAFRKAIGNANQRFHKRIDYLLIDAFYIPYVRGIRMGNKMKKSRLKKDIRSNLKSIRRYGQQLAIIKGDEKSISISAASIIAKVYRDGLMSNWGGKKRYKKYGWKDNKGYATSKHRLIIKKYGKSSKHRLSFLK